jgi:hypothetical protein
VLLGLLFSPEDGSDIFSETDTRLYIPKDKSDHDTNDSFPLQEV